MIDLTKITAEQANKIECALLQMEKHCIENMRSWGTLATDTNFSADARANFASNAQWWREVHELIYGDVEQ